MSHGEAGGDVGTVANWSACAVGGSSNLDTCSNRECWPFVDFVDTRG